MTAEIAVLNKFGVALAADSAITVDHFHEGEIKTKVYNTANKLFSLSKHEPVGIMFYNTVTLGGIPWETIVKCYRKKLGRQKFDHISDYSKDLFDWLNSAPPIFSSDMIKHIVQVNLFREFSGLTHGIATKDKFIDRLGRRISELEKSDYIDGFDENFGRTISSTYKNEIEFAKKYFIKKPTYLTGCKRQILHLVELLFTKKMPLNGYSGIVIAGFGECEALPCLEEYNVDIIISGRVRFWKRRSYKIDENNLSEVIPLADAEAMKTLIEGVSPTFRLESFRRVRKLLDTIPEMILKPITELTDAQKKNYISDARKAMPASFRKLTQGMVEFREMNYTSPIKQSIASLPISELGSVPESFLGASQVLKKVNPDIETIGGPVDIAVISKGDGFVWIKRKHYFDEKINPAFKLKYLDE